MKPGGLGRRLFVAGQPLGEQLLQLSGLLRLQLIEQASFVAHVLGERSVDQITTFRRQRDHATTSVAFADPAGDETRAYQPIYALGHGASGDHGEVGQLAGRAFEGFAGTPQRREHVEVALAEAMPAIDDAQLLCEGACEAMEAADHALRGDVDIGSLASPFLLNPGHVIGHALHYSFHGR